MPESLQSIVTQELAKYDWRLAEPRAEFTAAVENELRARTPDLSTVEPTQIARMVKRCYSRLLHTACAISGTSAYARAYAELQTYLFSNARHLLPEQPEVAQQITQQALVKILEQYAECRDPNTFLGWCKQIVVNLYKEWMRKRSRAIQTPEGKQYIKREISLEEILEEDENAEPHVTAAMLLATKENVMQQALREPMLEKLLQTLRRCLEKERRVRVLVELYLHDKSFAQVARELALSAVNVQVIKSRALQLLRNCLELKQLYADWYA